MTTDAGASEPDPPGTGQQPKAVNARSVVGDTTTLTWVTFIPQAKVDAPPVGCSYGSGYQFGGDNRGLDWTSSRYRTALNAVIDWRTMTVTGSTSVRPTTVYRKSTGALVSKRTASAANMKVYKLPGSSTNYVYIRMETHASNPYCAGGAIDGALTFRVSRDGWWEIRSGNHRLMPNHYIYIYNSGRVTDVYRRTYQNVLCLIGSAACDLADLTGRYGTFS